jgi:hypothetical protein
MQRRTLVKAAVATTTATAFAGSVLGEDAVARNSAQEAQTPC